MPLPVSAIARLAGAAGEAAARAAEILSDRSYQRSLPPPFQVPEPWIPPGILATVLRILAWAGLGVLVLLALTWISRRIGWGTGDMEEAEEATGSLPELPLGNAEAFAADGRYGEAIHALLLDTLAALSRAGRLAPSLTSREIVARVALAPGARDALGGLVDAVEVTWFGGAIPAEADYQRCLERFHAFRASYRSAA